jgi:hypothetical protein
MTTPPWILKGVFDMAYRKEAYAQAEGYAHIWKLRGRKSRDYERILFLFQSISLVGPLFICWQFSFSF